MVSPLLGAGAALATSLIPNAKIWNLQNLDSGETLQGQFEPQGLSEEIGTNWGQFTSLNRGKPILQFLNGNADQVSFQGRFFRNNALDTSPEDKLNKLKSWARIDNDLRRPPVLQFWVGDGHVTINCVIVGMSTNYGRPDFFGGLRDVGFTLNLLEFTPYALDDEIQTDTRYARAKERDYYELLAFKEYGNPLVGDLIRKDHPELQRLDPGDIVRLPSIEGIRGRTVTQTSVPLKTAFGKKDTAQKRLRLAVFDRKSESYVSHLLQPSTSG